MDKSVRWENIDLRSADLSKAQLTEIVDHLKARLLVDGPLKQVRLKKAIKVANSLLNAPHPKKKTQLNIGVKYNSAEVVGRFNGGEGTATFVSGGAPSSKR